MNHRLSNINNLLKRCVAVLLLLLGVRCGAQAVLFAAQGGEERLRLARESIGKRRLSEKQMDRLAAAFKSRGFRTKFLEWLKED